MGYHDKMCLRYVITGEIAPVTVNVNTNGTVIVNAAFTVIVLQISRLSEGSTGQIFATSSVIYQMKMWSL